MQRTRVKICGLTRHQDVIDAAAAGADAVGFVFYQPSPRAVSAAQAAELLSYLPAFVTSVGLFVDHDADFVHATLAAAPLDLLQFHGDETPEFCQQFNRPYIKAIRMKPGTDLLTAAADYKGARALLVDAYVPGIPGGTGESFNWQEIPEQLPCPLILAGGLSANNVADAINQVSPWAVDVSGGVEAHDQQGEPLPGIKSAEAITAFMRGVNRV